MPRTRVRAYVAGGSLAGEQGRHGHPARPAPARPQQLVPAPDCWKWWGLPVAPPHLPSLDGRPCLDCLHRLPLLPPAPRSGIERLPPCCPHHACMCPHQVKVLAGGVEGFINAFGSDPALTVLPEGGWKPNHS